MKQELKDFIDKKRSKQWKFDSLPGYGKIKNQPTDEELLINVLEYMTYWNSEELFEYLDVDDFCILLETHCNSDDDIERTGPFKYNRKTEVRHYKHIYIERKSNMPKAWGDRYDYTPRNTKDREVMEDPSYWYQDLLRWCKTDPLGKQLLRKIKLKRVLDNESI